MYRNIISEFGGRGGHFKERDLEDRISREIKTPGSRLNKRVDSYFGNYK